MEKKRVLILYASVGAGHSTAARAVEEVFAEKYPDIEVKNVDVLDFVFEAFKHGLPLAYDYFNLKAPFLYKWIYKYFQSRQKTLNNISNSILEKSRFIDFVREFSPDFIISTSPLPTQLVSKTKEKKIINIASANVCTDFGYHSFWHNTDVNYYFVATEEIKKSLVDCGVNPVTIQMTGIPTSPKFSKILDRKKIISDLRLDGSKPILLIVGGRTTYRKLLAVISGAQEKNKDLQFIIVAGRDKVLQKKLKNSKLKNEPTVRIFDFVNNLDEYMTAADLILTKAGGLTVSECLVKGLPMVINDIIPGQEEDNANYVASQEVGIIANNTKDNIEAINKLFSHPEELRIMKDKCKKMAKPNAAADLVDFIVSKI